MPLNKEKNKTEIKNKFLVIYNYLLGYWVNHTSYSIENSSGWLKTKSNHIIILFIFLICVSSLYLFTITDCFAWKVMKKQVKLRWKKDSSTLNKG